MNATDINTGDIFALGPHRLLCGEARNDEAIEKLLDGDQVQLIVTDPPYGVQYVEGKRGFTPSSEAHRAIVNDNIVSDAAYQNFTGEWLKAIEPHLAPKNAAYIFNCDRMLFALQSALKERSWKFGQLLIWVKTGAVVGRLDYLPQHELIIYCWKGTHAFEKSKDKSVLICPKPKKNSFHPTMKPISLVRRLILNSSKVGDAVYDSFGGSGSTLIAAHQTKRRCFMVEIDPRYCAVIVNRFEKLTGIKAEKHSNHAS